MDSIRISKAVIVVGSGTDAVSLKINNSAQCWGDPALRGEEFLNLSASPGLGEAWVRKMLPNTSYEVINHKTGIVKKVDS